VLTDDVVTPERDVVLEERRMRTDSDPSSQLNEAVQAALFTHHPYGKPIIGWMHEIEDLGREDALAYYGRFYTPENAILIVAGDVTDPAYAEKLVALAGTVDVLVNSAGINDGARPVDETGIDLWKRVIDVNLTGTFIMAKAALNPMLEAGRGVKAATPLAALAHQFFLAASGQGHGKADDSQVIRSYTALNGG
jgi:NAD(P)-dependent dehydrogenase (short-subunit alcohol dehydrogenase family)